METPNINASFGPNNSDSLWKITLRNIFNILLIFGIFARQGTNLRLDKNLFYMSIFEKYIFFSSDFICDDDLISAFTPCGALQMFTHMKNVQDLCCNMFKIRSH